MNESINTTLASTPAGLVNQQKPLDYYTCIRFIILPFGMFTNFVNICVFVNPKLKDVNYTYMLAMSCSNLLYGTFFFFIALFDFCNSCATYNSYGYALYQQIIYYLVYVLGIFRILTDITLSLNTYYILKNTTWLHQISAKLILAVVFSISCVFYADRAFLFYINASNNTQGVLTYSLASTDYGKSQIAPKISILENSLRIFCVVIVLLILNSVNANQFRKRFLNRGGIGSISAQNNGRKKRMLNVHEFISITFFNYSSFNPNPIIFA